MENSDNRSKIIIGAALAVALVATAMAAFAVYYSKSNKQIEDSSDDSDDEDLKKKGKKGKKGKTPVKPKANIEKKVPKKKNEEDELEGKKEIKPKEPEPQTAEEYRKKGNMEFTNRNYDEAIKMYTKALELGDQNAHFLFSNRSAAFLFKGDIQKAVEDALQCKKLKPDWAKGYFRLGKALLADGKYDEAYTTFYQGFLLDNKKNEELELLLKQSASYLSSCDKDSRTYVERETVKLFIKTQMETLCNDVLKVPYSTLYDAIKTAVEGGKVTSLANEPLLEPLIKDHLVEAYRVITEVLLDLDKTDEALVYSTKAYESDSKNPQVLLLQATCVLRSNVPKKGDLERLQQATELLREAAKLDSKNVQIIHTYATLLIQLISMGAPLPSGLTNRTLLAELKSGLDNKDANHLLVADCGMRIWFKLLEEHQEELANEEKRTMELQLPPEQVYLNGLTKGVFSKVCTEPFFLQALTQVIFANPGLEFVLAPCRSAVLTLPPGKTFDSLQPIILALAIQCFRDNYSFAETPDDETKIQALVKEIETMVAQKAPEELVTEGELDETLYHHITLLTLFTPIFGFEGLSPILHNVDTSKYHPYFKILLDKTFFNFEEEDEIKKSIIAETPIGGEDKLLDFYEQFVPIWDDAGLQAGKVISLKLKTEMEWLFKGHKFSDYGDKANVLVVGAGSGQEVYQMVSYYNDINVTALDYSVNNIAYALRQLKELGKENSAKFVLANYETYEAKDGQLYDFVVANNCLHFRDKDSVDNEKTFGEHMNEVLTDRLVKLASFTKPGGLIKASVFAKRFLRIIKKTRELMQKLRQEVDVFKSLPEFVDKEFFFLDAIPTLDQCRLARNAILNISNEEVKEFEELRELFNSPGFFALHEFADLVYNPSIWGFTYAGIGKAIKKSGLSLVGFEFPGLTQDSYLKYKVEFPNDPDMLNFDNLERFSEENPDAFKNLNYSINFVLEKPL